MGILSDYFLPNTLIHLWNFSETSFLASTSDFAASSSLSHISYSSTILFTSIVFSFFCLLFFCLSTFFLFSFLLLLLPLPPFVFAIPVSFVLVSTAFHILPDISLFSLPLSSSQSQDYGELARVFPRLPSTSVLQSHQSPTSIYALGSRYLPLQYAQLVPLY